MEEKKLFLLDAYALIYRAYYALMRSPHFTTKGLDTSAIFGFCNTLDELLRKENPSHIAVCFDPKGGQTFRHEHYPEYKANRDKQPEGITVAIPYIKSILAAYNIPVIEMERYEADDIIGTLSVKAETEGFTTYMMTPDKDYGQLVTDKVFMYRPSLGGKGFEIRGPREICERYGISSPSQVIDLLALEGDASDNIPGCPGVGPKTASKLINEFGSVENLLENTDKLKGSVQKKVIENAENIRFSKFLATIKTDVPVDINLENLKRQPENVAELIKIFNELEFKTLVKKFITSSDEVKQPVQVNVQQAAPSLFDFDMQPAVPSAEVFNPDMNGYRRLESIDDVNKMIASACDCEAIGVCLYSIGAEAMTAQLRGIAFSVDKGESFFVEFPIVASERSQWLDAVAPLFRGKAIIVSHDIKRDYIVLKNEKIEFLSPYFDTSVAHYLLQPEMRHSLSVIASTYINYQTLLFDDPAAEKKIGVELSSDEAFYRSCEQAEVVLRLRSVLIDELSEQELLSLLDEIELPLIPILAEMEWTGVRVDVAELNELSSMLTERLHSMEQQAFNLAGEKFNIASPSQVGEILFGKLQLDPKAKRTKTGAFSTTEEILEKYANSHPVVELILKIRRLRKLLTTYINALPSLINPSTGKIHTTYNQTITATGRLSSTNPNLQNIPVRSDDGREIRRAFISDSGDLFLSADYSQIELRLMADLSEDPSMIEAFQTGVDIHQATAAKINHLPLDQVTADQRRNAKTANFGIIYGISAFGLSERLGISRSEAKTLIDGYFETYPSVRQYMERSKKQAHRNGYVTTIMGRKRFLPDINSRNAVVRSYAERNAINAPLQGSAADIIKRAMIDIYRVMTAEGLKSKMIMQVHDELVFNVVPSELERLKEIIVKGMTNAHHGKVELEVSIGVGKNWLEAH